MLPHLSTPRRLLPSTHMPLPHPSTLMAAAGTVAVVGTVVGTEADTVVDMRHAATALQPVRIALFSVPMATRDSVPTPLLLAPMAMPALLAVTRRLPEVMRQLLVPTHQLRAARATVAAQEWSLAASCAAVVVVAAEGAAPAVSYVYLDPLDCGPLIAQPSRDEWETTTHLRKVCTSRALPSCGFCRG